MSSTPTYKNLEALIESPDSGEMTLSTQEVLVKRYQGKLADCHADAVPQGALGTGDLDGYICEGSRVNPIGKSLGALEIQWRNTVIEGLVPLPSDEVAVSPDNLSPRIETHPLFIPLESIADELAKVEDATRSPNSSLRNEVYAELSPLGKKLVDKIRRGHEAYYLAALRYSWATHYYTAPTIYRGGWTEAPGGPLAGYFVGDISWLREADDLQYNGGIWRLTRSWIGGPSGRWDPEIYS